MQELPFFSIIIPTYERKERLAVCLESLTHLDYPHARFEVIVIDDGSEIPDYHKILAQFSNQLDIILFIQPHAGPAAARNRGAALARGEFLAFTDDDCRPANNWLQNLAVHFTKTPDCLVGGQTINLLADNLYSTASQILTDYLYAYYNRDPDNAKFFASNNLALPSKLFFTIGGFDTTYPLAAGEDREFCQRFLNKGYKMIYAKDVLVYHAHELTLPKFWRQHFNYGCGAFCFRKKQADNNDKIKFEALSFYSNLVTYPFSASSVTNAPRTLLSTLLAVSQLANITGFFWEVAKLASLNKSSS